MSSANVQAIHALDDLRAALTRFGSEAQSALDATQQEIQRTFDWLAERANHWRNEVKQREEIVRQAQAALARCQASGYRDQYGNYHAPDCRAYENALLQARVRLHEAEAELQNVQQWTRHVQQAVAEYQREAQRMVAVLSTDLPKASALLANSTNILQSYAAMSAPSTSIGIPTSRLTASTTHEITQQEWFRNAMAEISPQERGEWGERAVLQEARNHGHQILLEHHSKTSTPGYDCVSWDGKSLHIWEAKNWSSTVTDLNAITPERMRANVEQLLDEIANRSERSAIVDAIQNDRVQWHIRIGPDADVSFKALDSLE